MEMVFRTFISAHAESFQWRATSDMQNSSAFLAGRFEMMLADVNRLKRRGFASVPDHVGPEDWKILQGLVEGGSCCED
eukprot:9499253-Alexandrium_andersonii.AAC.1